MRMGLGIIVAGVMLAATAPAATAEVLTFDSLAANGNGPTPAFQGNSVVVGDYLFTGVGGTVVPDFIVYERGDPANADPGGAALGLTEINLTYSMSRVDGTVFDISSIDVSQLNNDASGGGYSGLVAFFYDGVFGASFSHDGVPGYQTFGLAGTGIHTLGIRTINFIAIDNLVVSGVTPGVPEPATWAMMVGGFGLIGWAMRSRKPAVRFA